MAQVAPFNFSVVACSDTNTDHAFLFWPTGDNGSVFIPYQKNIRRIQTKACKRWMMKMFFYASSQLSTTPTWRGKSKAWKKNLLPQFLFLSSKTASPALLFNLFHSFSFLSVSTMATTSRWETGAALNLLDTFDAAVKNSKQDPEHLIILLFNVQ